MKTRVITAIIMISVLLPLIFLKNEVPLEIVGALFVLLATYEYVRLAKASKIYFGLNLLVYGIFTYYVYPNFDVTLLPLIKVLVGLFIVFTFYTVFRDGTLKKWFNPIVNIFYIGLGVANLIVINQTGYMLLIYLLIVISMTDTFAYLFGVRFGKHRLAPTISPKKSVEGAVAGVVFGVIFGVAYYYIFNLDFSMLFNRSLFFLIIMSAAISIVGQMGDLFASKIKRFHNVKDFGDLFPGHGGILDRFDSLLLSGMILMLLIY